MKEFMMLNPNVMLKNIVTQSGVENAVTLLARMLMSYIFIVAGWGKIATYSATAGYIESLGVPAGLLPLVIFVELGGGLALLFGLQARVAALGLGVFSVLTAFLFHGGADDSINFMKNLAMAGGLFYIVLYGVGRLSLDHLLEK